MANNIYQDAVTGVLGIVDATPEGVAELSEEQQENIDLVADALGDEELMEDVAAEIQDEEYNRALAEAEQRDGFTVGQPNETVQAILQRNRKLHHDANR